MPNRVHHIALTAADLGRSSRFYDAVLAALGYQRHSGLGSPLVYGGDGPDVLVYAVEGADAAPHRHGRPGLQHVAVEVDEPGLVDAVFRAAVAAGGTVVHEPQLYDYMPGYYAVFVEDPDGSRLEVVHIPAGAA
ncbi:VOC family protein [Dactylosporangium fulvum]|uniref:VOC family protein n=1 Tax=Dactylosporangium fulvum TaxID=53359 RepID=A0ABY5WBE2_9ACTN|nr:VOC family protein [Dactylosporangium fulvum]UWP86705.1 VOC family protein [Dactylosporangium fulvum]